MNNKFSLTLNRLTFAFILSLFISMLAVAEVNNEPEKQVKVAFGIIEQEIIQLKQRNEFNSAQIKKVLNQHLLPEINTRYFALKSLGKYAKDMSEETKLSYIQALQIQLINSYANLLSNYNNEKIVFNKSSVSDSGKIAQVYLNIESRNKTNTAVIKLMKITDDNWKIFDIVIEGISLVQTKQAELNSSIAKLGVVGTLEKLQTMNAKIESTQ
ncbi:MlaC/ttg2D family ABC transporter substrate-binding protein [Pseudocolwellia agarivorans]|uniref:MlaC/ttg2D family ABC transporter substrate-binding protein n=1 Tax=Pseudocolwellia agarivorans TaxID=1911682 RepID=UPI0009859AE1|nr:ABC transporter substrate-binding protein [Pseudocolwellia agarivorans]